MKKSDILIHLKDGQACTLTVLLPRYVSLEAPSEVLREVDFESVLARSEVAITMVGWLTDFRTSMFNEVDGSIAAAIEIVDTSVLLRDGYPEDLLDAIYERKFNSEERLRKGEPRLRVAETVRPNRITPARDYPEGWFRTWYGKVPGEVVRPLDEHTYFDASLMLSVPEGSRFYDQAKSQYDQMKNSLSISCRRTSQ